MTWYQIVSALISLLTLLGLGTITKLYWEDKHKKKMNETEEAKRRQKEERQTEIKDAVSEIVDPFAEKLECQMDAIEARLKLSEQCDQAALRNSLMRLYYDCKEKGYRTVDDSKNYREMHEAYNAIGGNSFIDSDISRWFEDLPLTPNDYIPPQKKIRTTKTTTKKKED